MAIGCPCFDIRLEGQNQKRLAFVGKGIQKPRCHIFIVPPSRKSGTKTGSPGHLEQGIIPSPSPFPQSASGRCAGTEEKDMAGRRVVNSEHTNLYPTFKSCISLGVSYVPRLAMQKDTARRPTALEGNLDIRDMHSRAIIP